MEADPLEIAREAVERCKTGPQPGELSCTGGWDEATQWSYTYLRWRHVRNGENVKEDFAQFDDDEHYDESATPGHSTEAHFHIFARDNLATLAQALIAKHAEVGRLRAFLISQAESGCEGEWDDGSACCDHKRANAEIEDHEICYPCRCELALAQEAGK